MTRIVRVEIIPRPGEVSPGYLLSDIRSLGIVGVERIKRHPLYFMRGKIDDAQVAQLCSELLADPIVQTYWQGPVDAVPAVEPGMQRIEVGLLPGVTDTVAANLLQRAHLLGITGLAAAATAQRYLVYGSVTEVELQRIAQRLLCNDVIQYYSLGVLEPHIGLVHQAAPIRVDSIPLADLDDAALL
ncbi:MAG: phosphoribosylformylglycinamidine synthase subunit PurS, partial [Anaerolineae bacterium]